MSPHRLQLLIPAVLGILIGFLTYWGVTRHPPHPIGSDSATHSVTPRASSPSAVTATPTPALVNSPVTTSLPQTHVEDEDEVFTIFPQDQWVKMPRGLMEHTNGGFDSLLFVTGGGEKHQTFPRAMMPGISEATFQAFLSTGMEFSTRWTQLAIAHLQRTGPHEWHATLPQDQLQHLHADFRKKLASSVDPGYAHLLRVLTYKTMATLSVPAITLKLDPAANSWKLYIQRSDTSLGVNMSEKHLDPDAPVRALLQRAKSLP